MELSGVLALDLATVTGWAFGPAGGARPATEIEAAAGMASAKPLSGAVRIARSGTEIGPFLEKFDQWLSDMIAMHNPRGLIFEAAFYNPKMHIHTARKLFAMAGMTEMIACRKKVAWVREVDHQTVKRHFVGSGRATKQQMMAQCRARGWWPVQDDNEADALAIHDYARACLTQRAA